MQSNPRERLLQFAHVLQSHLFERVEVQLGPLAERARLLMAVLAMVSVAGQVGKTRGWVGRPAKDRASLASAFLAKAIYGIATTRS